MKTYSFLHPGASCSSLDGVFGAILSFGTDLLTLIARLLNVVPSKAAMQASHSSGDDMSMKANPRDFPESAFLGTVMSLTVPCCSNIDLSS